MELLPQRRLVLAVALGLWVPLVIGMTVGWVADASLVGALLLFGEPLLVVVAVFVLLTLLSRRRWVAAGALALGCVGGLAALHLPPTPTPPPTMRPDWTRQLRSCAAFPSAVEAPVRLVHWTLADGTQLTDQQAMAIGANADVVVLNGTPNPTAGAELARVMGGEAKFYAPGHTGEGGLTVVVRGSFQYCGGTEDAWAMPLRAADGHEARAVVTFPRVEGAGVFPLVALRMDPPHGPSSWPGWVERLDQSGQQLAAVAQAIDASRMVVVGDFGVPPSFRRLGGRLQGAGLTEVGVPPTWPATVGPFPALPVHRLDRVWAGRTWSSRTASSLPADGQPRAPFALTLVPQQMQAG